MPSEMRWQQAADAVVREKHVKIPQQTAFGLKRFVFCLQNLVGDYLPEMNKHKADPRQVGGGGA